MSLLVYVIEFWKTVDIRTIVGTLYLKTMGRKKLCKFYRLTGGRIKPPMDKSWASSCSPVHREYKYLCIHERISKLQTFVYVAVTKKFTDKHFLMNFPSFSNTEACLGQKLYLGGCTNSWQNTMSHDSIPYAVVSVRYDGLCKHR